VLHFQEPDQALVLNRTNADIIKAGMGEDTDGLLGRQILLCPDTTCTKQASRLHRVKVTQPPSKVPPTRAAAGLPKLKRTDCAIEYDHRYASDRRFLVMVMIVTITWFMA